MTYRYVHGGFTDSEGRFAFYYPERDDYQGRFFQSTYPTVGSDTCSDSDAVRTDVQAGEPVALQVSAAAAVTTDRIVQVEWDFDGTGEFSVVTELNGSSASIQLCRSHTYAEAGTHYVTVRVTANRDDKLASSHGQVKNLDRVRVVVQ